MCGSQHDGSESLKPPSHFSAHSAQLGLRPVYWFRRWSNQHQLEAEQISGEVQTETASGGGYGWALAAGFNAALAAISAKFFAPPVWRTLNYLPPSLSTSRSIPVRSEIPVSTLGSNYSMVANYEWGSRIDFFLDPGMWTSGGFGQLSFTNTNETTVSIWQSHMFCRGSCHSYDIYLKFCFYYCVLCDEMNKTRSHLYMFF
jgi:hypothetical protein